VRDTVACCFLSLHCKIFLLAGCNIARNPIRTWMQKRTSFEFSAKRLYLPHKTPSDSQIPAICIISVPLLLIIHERTQFFCATSKAQACMESYFQSKVLLRITQAFQFVDANCGVVSRVSTGQADDQPQPNQLRHNQPRAAKATTRTEIGVFLTPHGWIRIERLRCVTAETSRFSYSKKQVVFPDFR